MLKEGTIPIVDQPLIQAVKYALDQLGINPDTLPQKKRRTCLDETDLEYTGYLKAVIYPTEKKLGLVCGFDPENEIAGYCWVNGQKRDVKRSVKVQAKEGFLCICGRIAEENIALEILTEIPGKPTTGDKDYHPIALVKKVSDSESFSLFQVSQYEFPQLWIFGDCTEEES